MAGACAQRRTNVAVEIQRNVALSTAHLSKEGRWWLDDGYEEICPVSGHRYFVNRHIQTIPFQYGWIVWCPEDIGRRGAPGEIVAAIEFAREDHNPARGTC